MPNKQRRKHSMERAHDMLRGRKQLQTIAERTMGVERGMCGRGWLACDNSRRRV